jgi:hypothetical protein
VEKEDQIPPDNQWPKVAGRIAVPLSSSGPLISENESENEP